MRSPLLDRAIGYLAPGWGAKRAQSRAFLAGLENATAVYEGAVRSWRNRGFQPVVGTSANAEIAVSLQRLRETSRHLRRNNPHAANAVTVIGAHVVGSGIIPAFQVEGARLNKRLQALAKAHLETTACDFDGRHTLSGLERLICDTVVEAGEALVVRMVPPASLKLPVPLQVRVLEPDYLDATKQGPLPNGNYAFEGIELDSSGRRAAYWLFDEHPGGSLSWRMPVSKRVPAEDVRHVFRQDRPGQMRGVPWCAPVIVTLQDLADIKDAERMRFKIASCFAIFLKGGSEQNLGQQLSGQKTRAGTEIERIEPGLIQRLPSGVEAQMATPPTVSGFPDFMHLMDHEVFAGYGIPYELGTGELREVSFISGRLGMQQFNRNVDAWRWQMLIPHACDGIGQWFIEAAQIALGATLNATMKWTPPRREMIEPSKEVPAMRDAIRSGLSSRPEEVRSLGYDPAELDEEQAADNKRIDALGLKYDSDGRQPLNWKPTPPEKADGT